MECNNAIRLRSKAAFQGCAQALIQRSFSGDEHGESYGAVVSDEKEHDDDVGEHPYEARYHEKPHVVIQN